MNDKVIGKIENISCELSEGNLNLRADNSYYVTSFFQNKGTMYDLEHYVKFIKKVEQLVRTHPDYKVYISLLLNRGLGNCSIMGNISKEDAEVEMHHGPILTLFDICSIITDNLIRTVGSCTSFEVAEKVLDEHFKNRVQVVFLSETAHQLVHANNTYISLRQAFGDLSAFLKEYADDISQSQRTVINKYIDLSRDHDTDFSELLKLRETVKTFN